MDKKLNALDKLIEAVDAGEPSEFRKANRAAFTTPCQDMALQLREEHSRYAFKGSLDASLALHEALLPNRYWKLEEWDGAWTAEIPFSALIKHEATDEHSAARAWLLAVLKAYRSVQQ